VFKTVAMILVPTRMGIRLRGCSRNWIPALVVVVLFSPLPAFQEPPAVFRTGVNLVLLDVSVHDKHGLPISGLLRDQFEVSENGVRQDISRFDEGTSSVSLALVLDFSGSMLPRKNNLLRGVNTFIPLMKPEDEGVLFIFNEHVQPLTEFQSPAVMSQWLSDLSSRAPTGMTSLYDAVIQSSRTLSASHHQRRAMIVLSDGKDTSSTYTLQKCIDELRSSNRLLYAIGLFQPGDPDTDAAALRKLAESTGGTAVFDRDGMRLSQIFTEIMRDLRARYVIGFYSHEGDADLEVRKLKVVAHDADGHSLMTRSRREYRIDRRTISANP